MHTAERDVSAPPPSHVLVSGVNTETHFFGLGDSFIKGVGAPEPPFFGPLARPEPWRWFPAAPEPRRTVPDARLRRLASLIHNLGERPLYELLREILAGRDPLARIERYAQLDADIVEALGADRLPDLRAVQ